MEPAVRVAAPVVHPHAAIRPQLAERTYRPVGLLEREPALEPDHGASRPTRAERRDDVSDTATDDLAVLRQAQHVAGQQVDPAQAVPAIRPHGSLAVVRDRVGRLLRLHADARAVCPKDA